jgi:hypothetical protein
MSEHWGTIIDHLGGSEITLFRPAQSDKATRVFDPIDFEGVEARKNSILSRCDTALAADVSRFYPTIYTHSIGWALHGKDWCKQNAHNSTLKKSLGQQLDDLVRKGQDGQSLGIPVGPDTSIVIAEIIGVRIDQVLEERLGLTGDVAIRYTDDFFIGLRDGRTPETSLAALSAALSAYELEIGSDKTRVVAAGTRAEPDWALELSQFRLPTDEARKKKAIEIYFKTAFNLAQTNPTQNVLSYCVSRAQLFNVDMNAWDLFEEFLLQSARANNSTIDMVARILIEGRRSQMRLNLEWIEKFVGDLLRKNAPLDHHWEVSWLLFLCRELEIKLSDDLVEICEGVESGVIGILLLDLGSRDLASVGGLKHRVARTINAGTLRSPEWLLAYEGARLGWLGNRVQNAVSKDDWFSALHELKIAFYDTKRTTSRIEKERVSQDGLWHEVTYFRF